LTGLTNRRGFLERLRMALERDAARVAVLFLDLDDFKAVNDSLGHPVGDDVLRILSRRLLGSIRTSDTAARLGGDEFAVLIEDCAPPDMAIEVGRRLVDAFAAPMSIGHASLTANASVGIALGADGPADPASLMRSADLALYRAKAGGKGRIEVFDRALHEDALVTISIRSGLAQAAARGQLEIRYQPIVALKGRRPVALEALVRWNHPELGFLMPGDFIHIAESTGQMQAVGSWVLRQACRDAAAWVHAGHIGVAVNVNVSPSQLRSGTFADDVMTALHEVHLEPRLLTLELTEAALEGAEDARETLTALASRGVRLAVDDFGAGYSSLSRVGQLPVVELKMDRSLLAGDRRMLAAVAELSRALDLQLVAEGIETAAELALAERVGCDAAQGFLLGAAVPVRDLARVLDRADPADGRRSSSAVLAAPAA
jgi:diguanylate cyclase (GGDEF)-like protein